MEEGTEDVDSGWNNAETFVMCTACKGTTGRTPNITCANLTDLWDRTMWLMGHPPRKSSKYVQSKREVISHVSSWFRIVKHRILFTCMIRLKCNFYICWKMQHIHGIQESWTVLFVPKKQTVTLCKITVDIIGNNFIPKNEKTQKPMKSTQKRDGRLQLRPKLIAISLAPPNAELLRSSSISNI